MLGVMVPGGRLGMWVGMATSMGQVLVLLPMVALTQALALLGLELELVLGLARGANGAQHSRSVGLLVMAVVKKQVWGCPPHPPQLYHVPQQYQWAVLRLVQHAVRRGAARYS